MLYMFIEESLIENWFNPNKLLSINKDIYLFIYLLFKMKKHKVPFP